MIIARTVACLLAGTAFLVACSKQATTSEAAAKASTPPTAVSVSGQAPSPQVDHPCALLTNADAEAVLGKLQRPEPLQDVSGGAHTCVWESESGHLTLYAAGPPEAVGFLQSQFGAAGGSPNVAVAGVGDTAGWLQAGGYLLVQKGGTTFVVLIAGPGASLDAAKSLALKVIARL